MFRHDDECVQEEFSLAAVFEDGSLKELRIGRHLKKAAALRRYCGHEVGTSFLRRQSHLRSINERPVAKATPLAEGIQGPEGPCSLRWRPVGFRYCGRLTYPEVSPPRLLPPIAYSTELAQKFPGISHAAESKLPRGERF